MRDILGVRAMVAFGLLAMVSVDSVGQDDPADAEKAKLKRWEQQLKESVNWYQVFSDRDSKEPMKPQTVMRWANPVRLQKGETALILWADAGRPEALASVYPWSGRLTYECVSLAREPGMNAREDGRTVWSPGVAGVTFREVPDAPIPAKSPVARLGQMKAIAEMFKITMISKKDGVEDREEMRLLPRAIYRYELAGAKQIHPDLIDGAMFAYVQGTDPEAVLMVEAVQKGDRTAWQYGFGRATGWTVEARLGASIVWTSSDLNRGNPKGTFIAMGRPLVD